MTMNETLARDVAYVREAVERSSRGPAGIYFVWALVVGLGGLVLDRRPEWAALYWMVATIGGVIASAALGWLHGRRAGVRSSRQGMRAFAHWMVVAAVTFGALVVAVRGGMQPEALGGLAFLVVALGYLLAGVHGDGSAWGPGAVALLGSGLLVFVADSWLLTGVVCGLALAGIGALGLARGGSGHG